ncbi:unnamed protein product [Ambrosiozyma monospora]|uniref:Unnamed protein product n=1 Tax=Ambrosiozyma monospora TaxID=43982 RepID=A0A9W7DHA5_AMBMO|nr:unnamed protein product [Ambrosiozyma monospora]
MNIISPISKTGVSLLKFSNGALAITLLVKQTSLSVPLIILTVSQFLAALVIITTMFLQLSQTALLRSETQLNTINIFTLSTSVITIACGCYWISNILFLNISESNFLLRQLLVAFSITFIVSIFADQFAYFKDDLFDQNVSDIEKNISNVGLSDFNCEVKSHMSNDNFILNNFLNKTMPKEQSFNTIRGKSSIQTLVNSFQDNDTIDSPQLYSQPSMKNISGLLKFQNAKSETIEAKGTHNNEDSRQIFPSPIILPSYPEHAALADNLPSTPSTSKFPETITEEHSSCISNRRDSNGKQVDQMDTILDNLSAIPAAAEPEWPTTSPVTNADGSPTSGINHITLEDWKKNAEKWMKSKERLGMGNSKSMFFNESGRPTIADARKPKFGRSVSDPSSFSSSHSTIEEKIQQTWRSTNTRQS